MVPKGIIKRIATVRDEKDLKDFERIANKVLAVLDEDEAIT